MTELPAPLQPFAAYRQFILYKLVPRNDGTGKIDKIPIGPQGYGVSVVDPSQWVTADEALAAAPALDENAAALGATGVGVGFVFTEADPFFFFDIDGAAQPNGEWSPLAQMLCQHFQGAAIELSQSGAGLHIFGQCPNPPAHGNRNEALGLELYTSKRFAALTGAGAIGDANAAMAPQIHGLIAQYFPANAALELDDWTDEPTPEWNGPADDSELLMRMLSCAPSAASAFGGRATVGQLWDGDADALADAYPDGTGAKAYNASAADAALCQHLAFWTGKDCERMERLFGFSGLVREKWTDRENYRRPTILKACAIADNVYQARTVADPAAVGMIGPAPVVATPAPILAGPVAGVPPLEPVATAAEIGAPIIAAALATRATMREGYQFIAADQQVEAFAGCVYVRDLHKVFMPDGGLLRPDQFKAVYGGYVYALDAIGDKTTPDAWKAFVESQAVSHPKAHGMCFRPELEPGVVVVEEGRALVNVYVPAPTASVAGDHSPFLAFFEKLLPNASDRAILLAYMAACVQHKGVKFQWAPLVQGVEGNGKTLLIRALSKAVGDRYTHLPNAQDLGGNGSKFTGWLQNKLFIGIEEVYVSDRREVSDAMKPLITNSRIEIQGKGADQVTGDNRANFFLTTNHKDAILKQEKDRRYAVFYTAHQTLDDLERDGMGGDYFPRLYAWLNQGGYAVVTNYLENYPIPEQLNPATLCHRAPETSSTGEALELGAGPVEQEIIEATQSGRYGFCGGWVSSMKLDALLAEIRVKLTHNKRRELLDNLGYTAHPGLKGGRVNTVVMAEGGKPRLYIQRGHLSNGLTQPRAILDAYVKAQGESMNTATDVAAGVVVTP